MSTYNFKHCNNKHPLVINSKFRDMFKYWEKFITVNQLLDIQPSPEVMDCSTRVVSYLRYSHPLLPYQSLKARSQSVRWWIAAHEWSVIWYTAIPCCHINLWRHVHNLQGDELQHTSGQLFDIQPSPIVTSVSEGTFTICEVMDCSAPVLVCFSDGLSTPALSLTHTVGPLCCDKGVSFNLLIVFSAAFNFSLRSVTSCCRWTNVLYFNKATKSRNAC